jgi:hypothetical protein
MPNVQMSEKCRECNAQSEEFDVMPSCAASCEESVTLDAIFGLCYNDGMPCRHVNACTSDPRKCGYWAEKDYPLMSDTLNCWSTECDECQWVDDCPHVS